MSDLEAAVRAALNEMDKDEVLAIVNRGLNPQPTGPYKATATILFYANPVGYWPGFRARFSYKCEAGNQHIDTAHALWIGSNNYLSETRNLHCDCQPEPTPVVFNQPNQQEVR